MQHFSPSSAASSSPQIGALRSASAAATAEHEKYASPITPFLPSSSIHPLFATSSAHHLQHGFLLACCLRASLLCEEQLAS